MLRTLFNWLRSNWRLARFVRSSFRYSSQVHVEVEKKFFCSDAIILEVTKRASFVEHFVMEDTYFDTADLDLIKRDLWLRKRNGTMELKWPQYHKSGPKSNQNIDFSNESTDRSTIMRAIRDHAAVQTPHTFQTPDCIESLSAGGVHPFASLSTHRTCFYITVLLPPQLGLPIASQEIFVDVDKVWFPSLDGDGEDTAENSRECVDSVDPQTEKPHYFIGEVVFYESQWTQTQTLSAKQKAVAMHYVFATLGIDPQPARGKVLEFIARYHPDHFASLRDAWQLASKGLY
ncbi:hypothetical protein B484DRAFT_73185 [Ochromonadaceae sp. CCMP2298]|nr:hypothetical protein B484DRAFT_73185 [Ochromonadaceae sp. CCMP2298]